MPGGRIQPAARVTGPQPLSWLAWLCAAATMTYVVGAPFWAADYPMMTEFPFHAASSSVFRHYTDPGWHFHEQFAFQMLAVPRVTLYALSAIFMIVLPPIVATKLAAALLLALLPLGLMVLCWGLRKSPLLGLWGLIPVWGVLAHWGMVDFLAALGLFAMALGLALRVVDRPSVRGQGALIAVLLLLFFTQAYRFPFALVMLVLIALVMRGRVESIRGLFIPLAVASALFVVWWLTRPEMFVPKIPWVWPPVWQRMSDATTYSSDIYIGDEDIEMFRRTALLLALTAVALLAIAVVRLRSWPKGGRRRSDHERHDTGTGSPRAGPGGSSASRPAPPARTRANGCTGCSGRATLGDRRRGREALEPWGARERSRGNARSSSRTPGGHP